MKKIKSNIILLVLGILFLFCVLHCSNESPDTPQKKMSQAVKASNYYDFYDILKKFRGMESLFTYGDMDKNTFEEKLFVGLLGDDQNANTLVAMIDSLPPLFNSRIVPKGIFANNLETDMGHKGSIPDILISFSTLTRNILSLEEEQVSPVYDFLDQLDEKENKKNGGKETATYIVELLRNQINYLSTLDTNDINTYMHLFNNELFERQIHEDHTLDFADYDITIEDFSVDAASGLAKIIEGTKPLFYDKEIRMLLKNTLHCYGEFVGDNEAYETVRELLVNIHKNYDKKEIGTILKGMWSMGPKIGPVVEEMDIEGYGKGGKQDRSLRDLLMCPGYMNTIFETLYNFYAEGVKMDQVDEHLITMAKSDPLCFPRDGDGEYGSGQFYQPTDSFSFKNYSALKGLLAVATRANVPFSFSANFLFESEGAENTKKFVRNVIPEADTIPFTSFVWAEMYEKGAGHYMGHGKPVDNKKGYGIMVDGVYIAPICPAIMATANLYLYALGDSVYNGPYDNIYDNIKWMSFERKFCMTLDIVKLMEYIPALKNLVLPVVNMIGIRTLPVTILEKKGLNTIVFAEIGEMLSNLPKAMTHGLSKAGLPESMIEPVIKMIITYLPLGTPVEGTDRIYLLPQDMRDLWILLSSLSYWDKDAFYIDRYTDLENPDNYYKYYDVSDYTYEKNKDKANRFSNLVAPGCVSAYLAYKKVVDTIPLNEIKERRKAAIAEFGVIYPFSLILNISTALAEISTEKSPYELSDQKTMPLLGYLEPLFAMESKGVIDSLLELFCVLGKPELKIARLNILEGLAEIASATPKDTTAVNALAGELLSVPGKAANDPRYWDIMEMSMEKSSAMYSEGSPYQIVDTLIDLLSHITSVDIPNDRWETATQGMVTFLGSSSGEKLISRLLVDFSNIIEHLNTTHTWSDILYLIKDALEEDGLLTYLVMGLEKNPKISWDTILSDVDRFLCSDIMTRYDEGSFWRDVYYLVNFMSEAFDNSTP